MHSTDDQPKTDQATNSAPSRLTNRRVSVAEAAVLLDLTEGAVRSRLKRGTLRKEKAKDGTVLVVLGTSGSPDRPTNSNARPNDRSTTSQPTDQSDLVEVLRDQVVFLRQQLEEEREANRENRRIIAGLVQRVPELEAAQEPREGHVTATEEADKGSAPPEQQEPSQRRSFWRQFFGLQ